jgi:DNA-binding transcriptional LysR family regulator
MSVAAPITFGRLHVLPVVTRLLRDNPDLSIRLTLSDRSIHLVEEGVDVAVRIGDLADSSLMAVRLGEVSRVLAASPAYLASRPPLRAPCDLPDHDLIAFEGVGATNEWRFGAGEIVVRVAPRLAVNSADAAIAAAEAGLGITRAISYQVRSAVLAGRLVPVLPGFDPPPLPVSAVHPARRIGSANVAAFIEAAREHFKANPLAPIETA